MNQPVTVHCRTCRKIVICTTQHDTARKYTEQHHRTHPGHWMQATIINPITTRETTIDIPNREIE